MSTGDALAQLQPNAKCDLDKSSSSNSIFNKSTFAKTSPHPDHMQFNSIFSEQIPSDVNNINGDQICKSNSHFRFLEDKVNNQQSEIVNLHKTINDLYNQLHYLKSVVHSVPQSPILNSRLNLTQDCTNKHHYHENVDLSQSASPTSIQSPREPNTTRVAQTAPLHHVNTFMNNDQTRFLQEVLYKLDAATEQRDAQINDLKKDINELRHSQLNSTKTSCTSAFIPIVNPDKPQSFTLPTSAFTSTPTMPFTMSLNNTLPTFSGKERDMPTKFIVEFEIRASSLFGYNDHYLIRAVQQSLYDAALTWYIQIQQERPLNTWTQFKESFLRRFRTPEKVEYLRGQLRSLWQGDDESTADYFERLKALISEIEPVISVDYIKRKFLQKLRKDIRDKMTLGLTSSLSDLVQKAVEIESNIVQQKIDDKLREAHKENSKNTQRSATINTLYNSSRPNSSSLTTQREQLSYYNNNNNFNNNNNNNFNNNNNHNFNNKNNNNKNNNQHSCVGNQPSRTFNNSAKFPLRSTQTQNDSHISRRVPNRNMKVRSQNNNRWCSFCSSTSHDWLYCYSNHNGPNYDPERDRHLQQQQYRQQLNPSFSNQQQLNPPFANQPQYQLSNQHTLMHQQNSQQQDYHQNSLPYSSSQQVSMSGNI